LIPMRRRRAIRTAHLTTHHAAVIPGDRPGRCDRPPPTVHDTRGDADMGVGRLGAEAGLQLDPAEPAAILDSGVTSSAWRSKHRQRPHGRQLAVRTGPAQQSSNCEALDSGLMVAPRCFLKTAHAKSPASGGRRGYAVFIV
jgi:hypothetical protein